MENEPLTKTRDATGFYRGGESLLRGKTYLVPVSDRTWLRWSATRLATEYRGNKILYLSANILHADSKTRAGYFRGYLVFPTEQMLDCHALFDFCDAQDQTLCDFAGELLAREVDLQLFCRAGEILFADLLELRQEFQGCGLGIAAFKAILWEMQRRFSISVCTFKPTPLQYKSPFPKEQANAEILSAYQTALKRLTRHYQVHLGAKRLAKGSEYWYVDINEAPLLHPTFAAVPSGSIRPRHSDSAIPAKKKRSS